MNLLLLVIIEALVFVSSVLSAMRLSHKFVYTEELNVETYDRFIQSDDLTVVYFFKADHPGLSSFFKEIEKSAGIMAVYEAKFGVVDCTVHQLVGKCEEKNSEEQVYMFRNGFNILDVSVHSMFNIDSIVSNVLQVVLLHQAPIYQTVEEKELFISEYHGVFDIVFSYQKALGTYDHRILMEGIFVYQNAFRFAISNEQKTVENWPFFNSDEVSGIWLLHCKSVGPAEQCPASKFRGAMERSTLAKFFRALELPSVHDIGRDGDFDPYQDSEIAVLYIFYDEKSEAMIQELIGSFKTNFFGLMGVTTVNVNTVDTAKYEYDRRLKLPLLALRPGGQVKLIFMDVGDTPIGFLERELKIPLKPAKGEGVTMKRSEGGAAENGNELDLESEMKKQDDLVAEMAYEMRDIPIDRTHLPSLTDKTFYVETRDQPLLLVLFYLTIDARNQIASRIFAKAAEVLARDELFPLATVECFDWTDVCGKVNVSVYPTVRIYRSGMEPVVYDGLLSVASIVTTAKLLAVNQPVMLSTVEEVSSFVDGKLPQKINEVTNVAVLGAFGASDQSYVNSFKMAAKKLHGRYIFGIVQDGIAESVCASHGLRVPCVIAIKHNDALEPIRPVKLEDSAEKIFENINLAILPLFPELSVENFPTYMAMKKPFVVLFASNNNGEFFQLMSSMVVDVKRLDIVLVWMDISPTPSGKPSPGEQILRHYVKKPKQEELLLINHGTGKVYQFSDSEVSRKAVSGWLYEIANGDIVTSMKLSDNEWKPRLPGFDFLKKMDDDAADHAQGRGVTSYMKEINEHGLGIFEEMTEGYVSPMPENVDLEDEIQMELKQLKHSRLYQEHRTSSSSRMASASEKMPPPNKIFPEEKNDDRTAETETHGRHIEL